MRALLQPYVEAHGLGGVVYGARLYLLRRSIMVELQPVTLKNCTLTRVGSANDGGYLMCDRFPPTIHAAYSYGVGRNEELLFVYEGKGMAIVDGVRQPLDNHQTKLRDRYRYLPRRDLPEAYRH